MSNDSQYFANKGAKDCAATLTSKVESWNNSLISNDFFNKVLTSWNFYHGKFNQDVLSGAHSLTFSGEQGELVNYPLNHYRNIARYQLIYTTSSRPSVTTKATNTDYKSLSQAILADSLLEYYMREKRLEEYLKTATEYAIVLGEGYIKVEWDPTRGEEYGVNEETGSIIYEGDLRYSVLSPYDVIRDPYKEDSAENDWLIVRSFKNKFDLIAKYPEYEDQILAIKAMDSVDALRTPAKYLGDTDFIPIYEFYHRRSDALPNGRYMLFVSDDAVLFDGALPYREIPVYMISPSKYLGAPFGYTDMFDLLPVQETINLLASTIITNQHAFGVQNVLIPKGSDINYTQLNGGLNLIEYTPGLGKPEAMNLTQTPAEIFNMLQNSVSSMETLSGINSVARGNPEANLRSGNALALVQAQAVQFNSGLQQSYIFLIEKVCTASINILKDFAKVPRIAQIVGKAKRAYMQEFTGDDLSEVNRVMVEISNPLGRTTAGRLEIANQLLQMGLVKNPDQYFTVLNTGQLETLIEGDQAELLLIRAENESMMGGEIIPVLATDSHLMHIKEHKSLLADPSLRRDPDLAGNVLGHIQEHIDALRSVDPDLLALLGQQPLQPVPQQGQAPAPGAEDMPSMESLQQNPAAYMNQTVPSGQVDNVSIPNPAQAPTEFQGMPLSPENNLM